MVAKLLDQFEFEKYVKIRKPVISKDGASRSAHVIKKVPFQIGEQCAMKAVLLQHKQKGAILSLDEDAVEFFHDFESYVADYIFSNTESWFGRRVDRAAIKRGICSVIQQRDQVGLPTSSALKLYKLCGDNEVEVMKEPIERPHYVVPIIEFRGLFMTEKLFSLSFCITSMLVGDVYVKEEEETFFDPQSWRRQEEDLTNPHDLGLDWNETAVVDNGSEFSQRSRNSEETNIFRA